MKEFQTYLRAALFLLLGLLLITGCGKAKVPTVPEGESTYAAKSSIQASSSSTLCDVFADQVVSVNGTFTDPNFLSSDPNVAAGLILGAPDQQFIQISDNSSIVLAFVDNIVVGDGNSSTAEIRVHNIDLPFPAAAKIECSADGVTFTEVTPPALNDTRSLFYDDNASGFLDLDIDRTGLSHVQFIRFTDLPGSIDGETQAPLFGFDLDAVEALASKCLIEIDIKPGSDPNSINCRNQNGLIPVAILTTSTTAGEAVDFDATTVAPLTVRFGRIGTEASEAHNKGHIEDVDGDGDLDMVLHFRFGQTGIQCGDTDAILTGQTSDGKQIQGSDAIQTVGG